MVLVAGVVAVVAEGVVVVVVNVAVVGVEVGVFAVIVVVVVLDTVGVVVVDVVVGLIVVGVVVVVDALGESGCDVEVMLGADGEEENDSMTDYTSLHRRYGYMAEGGVAWRWEGEGARH